MNFVPTGQAIPVGGWQMGIFDTSDVADALGYHELTPEGQPLGKVFAKTAQQDGASWTVTLSHELLEMLGDPDASLYALNQDSVSTKIYSYEVCDPVEDDSSGYKINNTLVSNFVFPEWFEEFWAANSTQFDFMKSVNMPLMLSKNGYLTVLDITKNPGTWQTLFGPARTTIDLARSRSSARHLLRMIPRTEWRKSLI